MELISENLLSQVLKEDLQSLKELNRCDIQINYYRNNLIVTLTNLHYANVVCPSKKDWLSINIYELTHLCKEWAVKRGYIIKTEPYDYMEDGSFSGTYWSISRIKKTYGSPNCGANETEFESVVTACEWILNKEEDINE